MPAYVLSVDEGTTGVRALVFDENSALRGGAYREVATAFPRVSPRNPEMPLRVGW